LGVWWVPRLEREREMLEIERQRAMQAEMEARLQRDRAEQALREAQAKEEARRQAQQGLRDGKD
jgi:hypothetical protein